MRNLQRAVTLTQRFERAEDVPADVANSFEAGADLDDEGHEPEAYDAEYFDRDLERYEADDDSNLGTSLGTGSY